MNTPNTDANEAKQPPSEGCHVAACSPTYPKNVVSFVAKWQPLEGPRKKAFWKEFRKAANAYAAKKNAIITSETEEYIDAAWAGIDFEVRYEMCKESFSIGFRLGVNSILENSFINRPAALPEDTRQEG